MNAITLAWLNLSRKVGPTILVLLSIAVSVGCSGILLRLYTLSSSRFSELAPGGDAIVGAKSNGIEILLGSLNFEGRFPDYIPFNLYRSIHDMEGIAFEDGAKSEPRYIDAVIPFLYFAQVDDFKVIGTSEGFFHRPRSEDNPKLATGNWFSQRGQVVIGANVQKTLKVELGGELKGSPWTAYNDMDGRPKSNKKEQEKEHDKGTEPESFPLSVVGVLAETHTALDRAIYANVDTAQEIVAIQQRFLAGDDKAAAIWNSAVLNYFLVYLKPGGMAKLQTLVNKRTVAQVVDVSRETQRLHELTGTGRTLGLMMTGLILALSWLAVAAMMMTRFDAMFTQVAVLRALGFSKSNIRNWLIWEGLILGVVACFVGAIIDVVLFPWVRAQLGGSIPSDFIMSSPWHISAPIWVCTMLATVAAVFLPLARIYRRDVHQALKGL